MSRTKKKSGDELDNIELEELTQEPIDLQAENEQLKADNWQLAAAFDELTESHDKLHVENQKLKLAYDALNDAYANLKEQFALGFQQMPVDTGKTYAVDDLNVLARQAKTSKNYSEAINAHRIYLLNDKATQRDYVYKALQHLLKLSAG